MIVHQYTTLLNSLKRARGQASGPGEDTEGPTEAGDPARGAAWEEPGPRETTDTVQRLHAATVAYGPTKQGRMQGCRSRVPVLWQSWTFLKSM